MARAIAEAIAETIAETIVETIVESRRRTLTHKEHRCTSA
jgi:hypothetical protein